jgi:hypothetical protein
MTTSTKITGLTPLNVAAIRETIPADLGLSELTATTATFSMDAATAHRLVGDDDQPPARPRPPAPVAPRCRPQAAKLAQVSA